MQINFAQDYAVQFKIKTKSNTKTFPSFASNKNWDGAKIVDLISTSNMGFTLESGKMAGWSVFIQPNGSWGWNIGDGKARLDYLPSELQKVNDGKWHQIAVSFYLDKKTAWLYFDERHVAIYSLSELNLTKEHLTNNMVFSDNNQFSIKEEKTGVFKIKSRKNAGYLENTPDKLTVMSWNIWHGARHNGVEKGIEQAITAIKESGAELVCMQETYGSGPKISDALGTLFYYRSSNLSVHSKYPIVDTYDLYQSFRFGGVRVKMGDQLVDVFSLWIHYLPDIAEMYPGESVAPYPFRRK